MYMGIPFWASHNEDHNDVGPIFRPLYFGKRPYIKVG